MGQDSIDSTWITFNKPKEATSHTNELVEHGGFLMALGLNGHLSKLGKLESFDYLVISHKKEIFQGILNMYSRCQSPKY